MREANKRFIRLLGYVVIVIASMQFHDLLQTASMLFCLGFYGSQKKHKQV